MSTIPLNFFFELYTADKSDYTPRPKSMRMKQVVRHIAEIVGWSAMILQTGTLEPGKGEFKPNFSKEE